MKWSGFHAMIHIQTERSADCRFRGFRSIRLFGALVACSMALSAAVQVEKIDYKGWPNSYRVSNGEVELVVTGDVGPRVIRFGFVGGQNLLKEYPEQLGKSGEVQFQLRGGHRVWKADRKSVVEGKRVDLGG